MNANATDRQARLAAALRENLKRRKRQTRERVREADEPAPAVAGEKHEPLGAAVQNEWQTQPAEAPGLPDERKGSD